MKSKVNTYRNILVVIVLLLGLAYIPNPHKALAVACGQDVCYDATNNPIPDSDYSDACKATDYKNTIHGMWIRQTVLQPTYAQYSATNGTYPVIFGAQSKACSDSYRNPEGPLAVANIDGKGVFNEPPGDRVTTGKAASGHFTPIAYATGSIILSKFKASVAAQGLGSQAQPCITYAVGYQAYNQAANTQYGGKTTTNVRICIKIPDTPWTVAPTSSVNKTTIFNNVTNDVTWTHNVKETQNITATDPIGIGYYWFQPTASDLLPGTDVRYSTNKVLSTTAPADLTETAKVIAKGATFSKTYIWHVPVGMAPGRYCQYVGTSRTSNANATALNSKANNACVTIKPPPTTPTVDPIVTGTPSVVESGDNYTFTGSFINTSAAVANVASTSWTVWLESGAVGSGYVAASGDVQKTPTPLTGSSARSIPANTLAPGLLAATYTTSLTTGEATTYNYVCATLTATGTAPTIVSPPDAPTCIQIQTRPYFQVLSGDVNAAAALTTDGTCDTSNFASDPPTISAFNKLVGGNYIGSGAQGAVYAGGGITDFVSGLGTLASTPTSNPIGLTFANTAGGFGGGFQSPYCIPDYWNDLPDGSVDQTVSVLSAGSPNVRTAGDVFINPPSGTINTGDTFTDLSANPLKWIIAKDIYISANVTSLKGVVLAASGYIYTCATDFRVIVSGDSMVTGCNKQLSVSGAMISGAGIKLQRTFGTGAAETFTYNPEVWLKALVPDNDGPAAAKGTLGKFDSLTLLPPVL